MKMEKASWSFFIIALSLFFLFVGKAAAVELEKSTILGTKTYLAKGGDSGSSGSGSSGSSIPDDEDDDEEGVEEEDDRDDDDEDDNDKQTTIRTQREVKQDELRKEVRLSEEERIKVRTKDGRTRIDITSGGVKTRLEYRDDRVVIKAEQEDGTEVELLDDTLFKIEERLGASGIKVSPTGEDSFVIQRGTTGAVAEFPLSIDLATNTLTVNTPAGARTVAVLPDQAVQNLIAANVVNRLGAGAILKEAQKSALTSVKQLITLGIQNNVPVYEINGISDQKFLGFIPVTIEKKVTVSAETGAVVAIEGSFATRVLDLLAF